jgi:inward rectifier potassium channel
MLKPREHSARTTLGEYTFIKKGIRQFDLKDPYHLAVSLTWPRFLLVLLGLYLSVNVLFATLYTIVPGAITNAHPGSFVDSFFFSVETLATVGYGEMYPGGLYGHLVSTTEIICGVAITAILTGLTFVRFSRPRPKFVFPDCLVVAMQNGTPTLMLRIGNGRANTLSDAHAKLNVLLSETTTEGTSIRRARELRLQRVHLPIFPLTWTIMHTIDETSPLHGLDADGLIASGARIFFTIEARDPSLSAMVQDLRSYNPHAVRFGMRYADVIFNDEEGTPVADMDRIGAMEPDIGPSSPSIDWVEREEQELESN